MNRRQLIRASILAPIAAAIARVFPSTKRKPRSDNLAELTIQGVDPVSPPRTVVIENTGTSDLHVITADGNRFTIMPRMSRDFRTAGRPFLYDARAAHDGEGFEVKRLWIDGKQVLPKNG